MDREAGPLRTLVALRTKMAVAGTQALLVVGTQAAAGTQTLLVAGTQALLVAGIRVVVGTQALLVVGTRAVAGTQALLVAGTQALLVVGTQGTVEWVERDSSAQSGAWHRRDTYMQTLYTRFVRVKRGLRRSSM